MRSLPVSTDIRLASLQDTIRSASDSLLDLLVTRDA